MERECLVTVGDQGFVYNYTAEDTDANVIWIVLALLCIETQ